MHRLAAIFLIVVVGCVAFACQQQKPEPPRFVASAQAKVAPSPPAPTQVEPDLHPGKVDLVQAIAAGNVAVAVKAELSRATAQHRQLVVYVGASWCEPCHRFHDAAAKGQLDGQFPALRLLEFDLDRDADRLRESGYRSDLIPLFSIPMPDGRASGFAIEGSIKGEGAVANLVPRLTQLLRHANPDLATDVTRPVE